MKPPKTSKTKAMNNPSKLQFWMLKSEAAQEMLILLA